MTATTIQVTVELKRTLDSMKMHPRETYGDVIERALEDLRELDEETKRDIAKAVKEIESGRYKTHEQVRKQMGF